MCGGYCWAATLTNLVAIAVAALMVVMVAAVVAIAVTVAVVVTKKIVVNMTPEEFRF